jgi:hypothetical protein
VSQRSLINIVLVAVVAGLAVFIAVAPEQEVRVDLEPLSNENPRAVSRVRLSSGTGENIELRRAEGIWHLVDPIRIAANDLRVNALIGVLGAPVHARIDASAEDLARFGLASPLGRILLDDVEILFGDTEPIHGRRYLLHDGRVALVDDAYFSHLSSSAANYASPALLGRDPSPRDIVLPGLRLYRDGDDWRLAAPDAGASADTVVQLVDAWRHAQATAVRPYEPSLDWNDEVLVELADGSLKFDLARTRYEVILGRPELGIQYHLTKSTGERLLTPSPP